MSDHNDFLKTSNSTFRLRADVLALMLKGAGYAALFCIGLMVLAYIVLGVSALLPEDSKEGFDPTPTSFLIDRAVVHAPHLI